MTREDNTLDNEKSRIDELRRRLKDLMPSDLYEDDNVFERFLRARNQNLDAAEVMLKNHLNWRKVHKIDSIRTDFKPTEFHLKFNPITRIAFDKEGAPVIYLAFGNLDIKGGFKSTLTCDILSFFILHLENYIVEMKEKSKEIGKPINQWVMIFDYENFSFANATYKPAIQYLKNMVCTYDVNYPERLKSAYLINGSFVFQICFAMFKPLLSASTAKKIHIYGTDFKDALLEIMDADQLPAFLGGKRTDPDGNPRCLQTVNFSGKVPERYYMTSTERRMSVIPNARLMVINRFSKSRVEQEVLHPGSNLEWRFTVKNKNIDFSVLYKENLEKEVDEEEVIVPKQRVETITSSENGTIVCEKAGIYILEFDNTYSWMHSKMIYYTINITKPQN